MQDLLRQRAPLIDDDMTEAYVGRRVQGRHAAVAFISAWQRVPPDHALDRPFWPDIANRYDEFYVAAYTPVTIAAGFAA